METSGDEDSLVCTIATHKHTLVAATLCLKKTEPKGVIRHKFTNSQHMLIIFGRDRLIQFSIDYDKKLLN